MNYESYSVADFVLDESFRKWVQAPDPSTSAFWESWVNEHPQKKEMIREAKYLIQAVEFREYTLSEASYERIKANIGLGANPLPQPLNKPSRKPSVFSVVWNEWQRVAVVLVIGILMSGIAWLSLSRNWNQVKYQTAFGETNTFTLPDSSIVTLNAHTTLRMNYDWSKEEQREVWLEGEAFFKVSKHPNAGNAKFIVHTNNIDIEILGTQFNVQHRRERTQVVLQEGKIRLSNEASANKVVMVPGDWVECRAKGEISQRKKVNPNQYTAWQQARTVFRDAPLLEIAHWLEDSYGLEVTFEDEALCALLFTGTLPSKDIPYMLQVLSKSFNIQIDKKDNQIFIRNKP